MLQIDVVLPTNRKFLGTITLKGETVSVSAAVDPALTSVVSPRVGVYDFSRLHPMQSAIDRRAYGTHALIFYQRGVKDSILVLHGGEMGEDNKLRLTEGNLRVSDKDLSFLMRLIRGNEQVVLKITEKEVGFLRGLIAPKVGAQPPVARPTQKKSRPFSGNSSVRRRRDDDDDMAYGTYPWIIYPETPPATVYAQPPKSKVVTPHQVNERDDEVRRDKKLAAERGVVDERPLIVDPFVTGGDEGVRTKPRDQPQPAFVTGGRVGGEGSRDTPAFTTGGNEYSPPPPVDEPTEAKSVVGETKSSLGAGEAWSSPTKSEDRTSTAFEEKGGTSY